MFPLQIKLTFLHKGEAFRRYTACRCHYFTYPLPVCPTFTIPLQCGHLYQREWKRVQREKTELRFCGCLCI